MNSEVQAQSLAILERMKVLLSSPVKWTQRNFARAHDGVTVFSESAEAVCWCQAGARRRAIFDIAGREDWSVLVGQAEARVAILCDRYAATKGFSNAVWFNDATTTTHADILKMLDDCIEKVREEIAAN